MILALIGMMGSGKTTVGKALAQMLAWPFVDLDQKIEQKASIKSIFLSRSEAGFREVEFQTLSEVLHSSNLNLVLALGGGTVLNKKAVELLTETCFCVYLKAEPDTIYKRIVSEKSSVVRPLLCAQSGENLKKRIEQLMQERSGTYSTVSDLCINTEGLSAIKVAENICTYIKERL